MQRVTLLPSLFLCLVSAKLGAQTRVPGQDLSLATEMTLVARSTVAGEGPGYFLSSVRDARFIPTGGLLVHDQSQLKLLRFDAKGMFVGSVGREGQGPGEFLNVTRFGWVGDTLWVTDIRQQRISWFLGDALLTVATSRRPELREMPAAFLSDGTMVALRGLTGSGSLTPIHATPSGEVLDTIGHLSTVPSMVSVHIDEGNINITALNVFADHALVAPAANGNGIAFVSRRRPGRDTASTYSVIALIKGEKRTYTYTYAPNPISDREIREATAQVERYYPANAHFPMSRARFVEVLLDSMRVPAYAMPVHGAIMDSSGRPWLNLKDNAGRSLWVGLGAHGKPELWFQTPPGENVLDIGDGVAVTVRLDSMDVPSLTVHEMRAH